MESPVTMHRLSQLLLPLSLLVGCAAWGMDGDLGTKVPAQTTPDPPAAAPSTPSASKEKTDAASVVQTPGQALYERWCTSCHGPEGDGTGLGARYVYPPPRDLRRGHYSLVTSSNGIASREDIVRVLRDGMPGTAMTAYDQKLNRDELDSLAEEVMRLREAGARDRYLAQCTELDEPPDERECGEFVARQTTAGETLSVPPLPASDPAAIERGRQLFERHACTSCHGPRGMGHPQVALEDERGYALRPRDLVYEPFKGGHEPAAVYRRIRLGFPSGPMPAHPALAHQEIIDLVHYVTSLSRTPKRVLTNWQQRRYATSGLYIATFGDEPDQPAPK